MSGLGPRTVTVVVEPARVVREVLLERPAEQDVEELHPMADREHRQIAFERGG
jgi:hypothetical protein